MSDFEGMGVRGCGEDFVLEESWLCFYLGYLVKVFWSKGKSEV